MFYLSNRKLRLLIITLLLFIFCFFLGLFNAKALEYTIDINMDRQIYIGTQYGTQNWENPSTNIPEIVLEINKLINCNSGTCLVSIPFTISFTTTDNNFSIDYETSPPMIVTWGTDPNYTCSYSNGSIDCPVRNGDTLKKIEIFYQQLGTIYSSSTLNSYYTWGGYLNIYNIQSIGSSISNIQNNTNDIKNSINDSNVDSASSSASTWNNKNATIPGTITDILTLPITLLSSIVNNINNSCSSFSLGSLFGTNIILPCIDISALIGSGLWTTIDILFSGFMILNIGKKFVKIFNDFTNLKSNQIDELYGGGSK